MDDTVFDAEVHPFSETATQKQSAKAWTGADDYKIIGLSTPLKASPPGEQAKCHHQPRSRNRQYPIFRGWRATSGNGTRNMCGMGTLVTAMARTFSALAKTPYGQNNADYSLYSVVGRGSPQWGVRMNIDDSRLIAQFQRLITEMLVEKRLGQRRSELTDELYQTWREVQQRGLNKTPEYRNVLLRADQHALWLAGLVRLSSPDAAPPLTLKERELTAISQEAA